MKKIAEFMANLAAAIGSGCLILVGVGITVYLFQQHVTCVDIYTKLCVIH